MALIFKRYASEILKPYATNIFHRWFMTLSHFVSRTMTTWSLLKLTYCRLDISIENKDYLTTLTITSSSPMHLSMQNPFRSLKELISLFYFTPHLQCLRVGVIGHFTDVPFQMVVPSIKSLNLTNVRP
jgi:hypothetical protein